MAIRVIVIGVVGAWGISQVRVPVLVMPPVGIACHPSGFLLGFSEAIPSPQTLAFSDADRVPSWNDTFYLDRKSKRSSSDLWSVLGDSLCLNDRGPTFTVGIKYWLALTMVLTLYAIVRYVTRKPPSLRV